MKKKPAVNPNRRIDCWSLSIDLNSYQIFLRKKRAKPEFLDRYQVMLSPGGNLYGRNEQELFMNFKNFLRLHIARLEMMLKADKFDLVETTKNPLKQVFKKANSD